MKRKFVAVVLGLTLTITPVSAFAAENSEQSEQQEQQSSVSDYEAEEAENTNRLTGIVKAVGEDSITIELKKDMLDGEVEDNTENAAADGMDDTEAGESYGEAEDEDAAEDTELTEGSDASESNGTAGDEMAPGEERIIMITEDTKFYYVPDTEDGRLLMEEFSENSDESSELQTNELTDVPEEDISENSDEISELQELEFTDVKEEDTVSITLDEDGNASIVLVMFADGEDRELSSESGETEILLEDMEGVAENTEE